MRLKLLAGAALATLFTASGASAQVNGWYGAIDAGMHRPEGIEATSNAIAPDGSPYAWTFNSEEDWVGFARLGYRFSPNWRVELEGGYRPSDVSSVLGRSGRIPVGLCTAGVIRTTSAPTCGSPDGEIEAWSAMANVIYDFGFPGFASVTPFVGLGVGFVAVDVSVIGQVSNVATPISATNPQFQNVVVDDTGYAVAYQGLAGLTFNATERLAIDLTYRYLRGYTIEFTATGSAPAVQPGEFTGSYDDQSLTLGLRYAFAPPPPPPEPPAPYVPPPAPYVPPPEPPPAPVVEAPRPVMREFVVYFPFDQSILTPEAQTVVQEAASYAQQGGATQVQVVGHADTSGSAAYNVRLSERRARAVADAMVGLGVNPGVITADWRGETQPAVQTGDGVREPLNRRASININF